MRRPVLRIIWINCVVAEKPVLGRLATMKADVVALARLVRYSEEEALRLGVSGVVVECLRMAGIELANTIEEESSEGRGQVPRAARMN
jgi:hypothetical protein